MKKSVKLSETKDGTFNRRDFVRRCANRCDCRRRSLPSWIARLGKNGVIPRTFPG